MGDDDSPIEPFVRDYDANMRVNTAYDRGVGRRLYGERHRYDQRELTLHPDEMQIGYDEPTRGSGEEFGEEENTEELLRHVIRARADQAEMHFRVYGRVRLRGDLLQQSRDLVHNHRMNAIKEANDQVDLLRRNGGN